MKWNQFYMMILWSESLRIIIVANKKMLISQHHLDTFALKQRVYLNNNDSRENVTTTAIRINWELNKRLKESTLIITHHEKLKELIAKTKYLANVATENRKYHEKIYKVYSDSQTFLKTVKAMILTKDQTHLQQVQIAHESIWSWEVTLKLHWVMRHAEYSKMKWWTRWLMMHMIYLYCWLSINALKWWQDWCSYRNRSDKHEK